MDENQNEGAPAGGNPLVWGVLVVIVLLGLGWYFMGNRAELPQTDDAAAIDPATQSLSTQGSSDELADIEADVVASDFSSLEEIDQI